ncbi:MAG: flagellar export chaperone FliS [Candidatus Dadabacteria bacterium]|nr:MAG: flagellar export chaperone FliS [Candidatus Dadabacteria bacterium]
MHAYALDSYRQHEESTYDRTDLLLALYEALDQRLDWAWQATNEGRTQDKLQHIRRAADIVSQLICALDFDADPDVATKLAGLYSYMDGLLADAMLYNDLSAIETCRRLVQPLMKAWRVAVEQVRDSHEPPRAA